MYNKTAKTDMNLSFDGAQKFSIGKLRMVDTIQPLTKIKIDRTA
jgi:hypothetical protein